MQTKTKSMFLLLLVLVIGFILGALSSAAVRHIKGDRIARMGPDEQFRETMEKIIKPTKSQKTAIEQVLKRQSERIASIQQQRSNEFFAVFDSSRKALDKILTIEQKDILEQHMMKTRKNFSKMEIDRLDRMLDLTSSQKKQIEKILLKRPEPPDFGPDPAGGPKEFGGMRHGKERAEMEIEKILTPEQLEKYREFKSHRPRPFEKPMRPMMKE